MTSISNRSTSKSYALHQKAAPLLNKALLGLYDLQVKRPHQDRQKSNRRTSIMVATVSMLTLLTVLSSDLSATDVELTKQLTKVNTLTSGQVAKTGLIVGTISSAIIGLFKNSWIVFISSIGIGIGLSYYLDYLKSWNTTATGS